MNKNIKKVLAVLLIAAMLFSLAPAGAFADGSAASDIVPPNNGENGEISSADNTAVVQLTIGENGTATTYATFNAAIAVISAISNDNTEKVTYYVTLLANAAANANATNPSTKEDQFMFPAESIVLDLNGYNLTVHDGLRYAEEGATITVKDTSEEANGRLILEEDHYVGEKTQLTLHSGTIYSSADAAINVNGQFNMTGGSVVAKVGYATAVTVQANGSVAISGGTLCGSLVALSQFGANTTVTISGGDFYGPVQFGGTASNPTYVTKLSGGTYHDGIRMKYSKDNQKTFAHILTAGFIPVKADGTIIDNNSGTIFQDRNVLYFEGTIAVVCEKHISNDNDHICDICKIEIIKECADTDRNHKCDVCGKVISVCVNDDTGNHECDICGEAIGVCADTDSDYKCDVCGKDFGTKPSSSSGGGFSGSYNHPVKADNVNGADVTFSDHYATAGETVTITVKPEAGKKVDEVIVTNADGDVIPVTKTGDHQYTFIMPAGKVNVEVTTEDAAYSQRIVMQIDNNNIVNNNKTITNDVAPVIVGDRTLVPIRVVTELLGGSADWDDATRTVTLKIDGKTMNMTIGKPIPGFGTSAVIMNDRTYVPVRYVMEMLGAEVTWIAETQQIIIEK